MPFDSRTSFKLADLLYLQVQMSAGNISELMEIMGEWVWMQFDPDAELPFTDVTGQSHLGWD